MTPEEGNKLIRKFMDHGISSIKYPYDKDWNFLMAAWEKCYIRLLEINTTSCHFYIDKMKSALVWVDIKKAWGILVASIEFINESK